MSTLQPSHHLTDPKKFQPFESRDGSQFRKGLEVFDQKSKGFFDRFDAELNRPNGLRQVFENGFDRMSALMRNSHSYRAHHLVTVLTNHNLQKPDERRFPRTIKRFWKLQNPKNGKSNSSPGTGDLSLTMGQLAIYPICSNSTLLNGLQRIRRLSLGGTRVIVRAKVQLLQT
jgi:hypothetical protein